MELLSTSITDCTNRNSTQSYLCGIKEKGSSENSLSFEPFNTVYGEDSKNYKLMITKLSDSVLHDFQ
jgi:hypothetical protein